MNPARQNIERAPVDRTEQEQRRVTDLKKRAKRDEMDRLRTSADRMREQAGEIERHMDKPA